MRSTNDDTQVRRPISTGRAGEHNASVFRVVTTDASFTGGSEPAKARRICTRSTGPSDYEAEETVLSIHPHTSRDGLLVKIQPPQEPKNISQAHVPVDIVLVIDVSGSMGVDAPVPGSNPTDEHNGLSILDLVKHAALTIVETLDEDDRLGIVTFSDRAQAIQPLLAMDPVSKEEARGSIRRMRLGSCTNLWGGIKKGLELFNNQRNTGRVPAIMVLTDGQPNHMCPHKGYIPKLREAWPLPAAIHTFGFGYSLRSGLLKSIAEFTGGNYAFIPDAGMIGTVFVHAVANLQSTFAINARLTISYQRAKLAVADAMGETAAQQPAAEQEGAADNTVGRLVVQLGSIQYGQSRDVVLSYTLTDPHLAAVLADRTLDVSELDGATVPVVGATLEFTRMMAPVHKLTTYRSLLDFTPKHHMQYSSTLTASQSSTKSVVVGPQEHAFHCARARTCAFIASMFKLHPATLEHMPAAELERETYQAQLQTLISTLQAKQASISRSSLSMSSESDSETASPPLTPTTSSDSDIMAIDEPPLSPHQRKVESHYASFYDALLQDLTGQVTLSLSRHDWFTTWGVHFLPSLHAAHHAQICNSFKDPGPQSYLGASFSPASTSNNRNINSQMDLLPPGYSPLFVRCRNALDEAFESLPPPEPSNVPCAQPGWQAPSTSQQTGRRGARGGKGSRGATRAPIDMRLYHNAGGACFAGSTPVAVLVKDGNGETEALKARTVSIGELRRGNVVVTPAGPAPVHAVLRTRVAASKLCDLGGGVQATEWHPVRRYGNDSDVGWVFPINVAGCQENSEAVGKKGKVRVGEDDGQAADTLQVLVDVYSVQLERLETSSLGHRNEDMHALLLGAEGEERWWGVTLGHGVMPRYGTHTGGGEAPSEEVSDDIRAHGFFGDWDAVDAALQELGDDGNGVYEAAGLLRDASTGSVVGLAALQE